jgi:uncharacterized RDD family membrane protein YckC
MSAESVPHHASLLRRVAAGAYDLLPLVALWMIATALVLPLTGGAGVTPQSPGYRAYQAWLLAVAFAYYGVSWRHGGQTIGMRAWRLRVVRDDGGPLGWRAVVVRFAVALLSLATLGAGVFAALFDARRRMWHDVAAGTEVVLVPKR